MTAKTKDDPPVEPTPGDDLGQLGDAPGDLEPAAPAEPTLEELGAQTRLLIMQAIVEALSPDSGGGVNIVFAEQAAKVYRLLFDGDLL